MQLLKCLLFMGSILITTAAACLELTGHYDYPASHLELNLTNDNTIICIVRAPSRHFLSLSSKARFICAPGYVASINITECISGPAGCRLSYTQTLGRNESTGEEVQNSNKFDVNKVFRFDRQGRRNRIDLYAAAFCDEGEEVEFVKGA